MKLEQRTLSLANSPAADSPEFAALVEWYQTVRLGFHQSVAEDGAAQKWIELGAEDNPGIHGMYDIDPPLGEEQLVGTFFTADKTVNVGVDAPQPRLAPTLLITDVTVLPTHRRRGILRDLMTTNLRAAADRGLALAALTVSEGGIYRRFGFGPAIGTRRIEVRTDAAFRLRDSALEQIDGAVQVVSRERYAAVIDDLFARFHQSTAGSVDRLRAGVAYLTGEYDTDKPDPILNRRHALFISPSGEITGAVTWSSDTETGDKAQLRIHDFVTTNIGARLGIWKFLSEIDLATSVRHNLAPIDDSLQYALVEPDVYQATLTKDLVWLRVLDVAAALQARGYVSDGDITLAVSDDLGIADGTYRLTVADGTAQVRRTETDGADVELDVAALGSALLGGVSIDTLAGAGLVTGTKVTELARLLSTTRQPYVITAF